MSQNYSLVPIRIEGLFLTTSKQVSAPLADFSKLPWNNQLSDINSNNAFVSDGIINEPFSDLNLLLESGLHLHFIIPHFLGQAIPKNSGLKNAGSLPAAPNRWLVSKHVGATVEQWLIESDYIHDVNYAPKLACCCIPFNSSMPYRFMGRTTLLNESRNDGMNFKQINGKALTVAGYGDIRFSAFYPDCLGVFGFYDAGCTLSATTKYTILGWNNDVEDDLLFQSLTTLFQKDSSIDIQQINNQIQNLYGFNLDTNNLTPNGIPRTLFYGEFIPDSISTNSPVYASTFSPPTKLKIALANTSTEALSAFVASEHASGDTKLKQSIEEQLESALMVSKLSHLKQDVGAKFLESRHEKGFRSSPSGKLWKIATRNNSESQTEAKDIPSAICLLLDNLNTAQALFDKGLHEIASLQEQLYADWNKYMHARYPNTDERGQHLDGDEVMFFIENFLLTELNTKVNSVGQVIYDDTTGNIKPANSGANDLANALCSQWQTLNSALSTENELRTSANQDQLLLIQSSAPSYWEAHSPVIMISGMEAENDNSSELGSQTTTIKLLTSNQTLDATSIATQNTGDILSQCIGTNSFALSAQKWNPFRMDWEVCLYNTHLHNGYGSIDPLALKNNFHLDSYGPDFKKNDNYKEGKLSVFSGNVILSPHSTRALLNSIIDCINVYFKQNNISYTDNNTIQTFLNAANWSAAYAQLVVPSNFSGISINTDFSQNPIYTLWTAYQSVVNQNVLSQTISGFNEALIMKKKVPQLPIAEPIGFDYSKIFTEKVRNAVGSNRKSSPITAFDFNPIRSGKMSINRLLLIDNFGLSQKIDPSSTETISSETLSDSSGEVFLKPRLAQPARLNFRWLSANGNMQMNSHPESTPICGWLMADYLNSSINVYDTDGNALGYIDKNASWKLPPWVNETLTGLSNITNLYLQRVVQQMCRNNNYFSDMLITLQSSQNNISPSSSHIFDSKAMLIGKPIAVVRTQVSLEVKGLPAIDQSLTSFLGDINSATKLTTWNSSVRNTDNWTSIQLPLRLGEHLQLNDGLLGYWQEDNNGNLLTPYIAPQVSASDVSDQDINAFDGTQFQTQYLTINNAVVSYTMLVDPLGVIHASTGILPVKSISIPPEYYLSALQKLSMWFKTSPVLQASNEVGTDIILTLPSIPDYSWQWWDNYFNIQNIKESNNTVTNNKAMLRDGWLKLTPDPKN
jgi:hypothetical protein